MNRQRVPKGQVFQKSEEKVIKTLLKLDRNCNDDAVLAKFKELFPEDWMQIIKRYEAHERLTPPGKSHPMPVPPSYLLNKFRKYRDMYKKGEDLEKLLDSLNTPEPKFVEGVPENIEDLIGQVNRSIDRENRIISINKLAKFKCDHSIKVLTDLLESDNSFEIRKLAYDRLKRFGCNVRPPSKKKTNETTEGG